MALLSLNALDVFHAVRSLVWLVKLALAVPLKHEEALSVNVNALICRDVWPETAVNESNLAVLLEDLRDVDVLQCRFPSLFPLFFRLLDSNITVFRVVASEIRKIFCALWLYMAMAMTQKAGPELLEWIDSHGGRRTGMG